jgi:SH3 domain-containing YSC84-like protein 1
VGLLIFQVGRLKPEKYIPDTILRQAKGLAIVTVVKVGMMVTYKLGSGLVVARRVDGSWSPPSAISTCGIGYGAQVIQAFQVFFTWKGFLLSI